MRLFAGGPGGRGPARVRGAPFLEGQGGAWSCQWSWSRSKIGLVDESSSTVVVVKSVVVVELWSFKGVVVKLSGRGRYKVWSLS